MLNYTYVFISRLKTKTLKIVLAAMAAKNELLTIMKSSNHTQNLQTNYNCICYTDT
jgi:hypothetical protein